MSDAAVLEIYTFIKNNFDKVKVEKERLEEELAKTTELYNSYKAQLENYGKQLNSNSESIAPSSPKIKKTRGRKKATNNEVKTAAVSVKQKDEKDAVKQKKTRPRKPIPAEYDSTWSMAKKIEYVTKYAKKAMKGAEITDVINELQGKHNQKHVTKAYLAPTISRFVKADILVKLKGPDSKRDWRYVHRSWFNDRGTRPLPSYNPMLRGLIRF